jgi:CRP-like cAMP-binding protein
VHALADRKRYADFLEVIPAFSTCTRMILEEFVTHDMLKVHCAADKMLCLQTPRDQNFYVLVAGSALLDAGDDVITSLEPGDYFGTHPAHQHHLVASVVAMSDIEVLVITPRDVTQLAQASSRYRHPSKIEWRIQLNTTTRRASRRSHRRTVLASQGQ